MITCNYRNDLIWNLQKIIRNDDEIVHGKETVMELFRTDDFYIFAKGEYSLWWDRLTGAFIPKTGKL